MSAVLAVVVDQCEPVSEEGDFLGGRFVDMLTGRPRESTR